MQLIVFIGVQAAGKSTFFKQNFVDTHIRINLDMLKTRHREQILFQACLEAKQPLVIDNTNPTPNDHARYVLPAKAAHFKQLPIILTPALPMHSRAMPRERAKRKSPKWASAPRFKNCSSLNFQNILMRFTTFAPSTINNL